MKPEEFTVKPPGRIRIGNKRSSSPHKPEGDDFVVHIDRPGPLGNPYMVTDRCTRARAIDEYRVLLETDIRGRSSARYAALCEIMERLQEGYDVILMCWCHPLPCHGDVIKEVVERLLFPGRRR